jgi:SagB-type dehydrogenase family enzyme
MDWAGQPEEFRFHHGAPVIPLTRDDDAPGPEYGSLYTASNPPQPINIETISTFCYHSLAVSAWKSRSGATWAQRVNPSSGNLHPLEAYLATGGNTGIDRGPGLFHYDPRGHALERIRSLPADLWAGLVPGMPENAFLVGLTVIHWRCSWKYGERAWRYCRLDAGHALAALRFAAAALGWGLRLLRPSYRHLEALFGLHRQDGLPKHERETPELLAAVAPGQWPAAPLTLDQDALDRVAAGPWEGEVQAPETGRYRDWASIDRVERACRAGDGANFGTPTPAVTNDLGAGEGDDAPALPLIRQRRSATALDRRATLPADRFYRMLSRLLPACCPSPWDALDGEPLVDLHLMVHRVDGLAPGLYTLVRRPGGREALEQALNLEFSWERPRGCPEWLPLHFHLHLDLTDLAEGLSCGQEMGGDAIFTLGMTAEVDRALERFGAAVYRRLYQEAGMLGQALYLEAEAADLRGCGIGCYFDDGVHKLLGSHQTTGPQSLYHFVVGREIPERWAELLPAYPPPEDA